MSGESTPSAPTGGTHLNPSHARAIRATFAHVSDLLSGVARAGHGELTPFDRQLQDLSPDEVRRLTGLVEVIYERMLQGLQRLGVPRDEPEVSARWSVRTALLFSDIALSELSPRSLRAYGALGEGEGEAVTEVAGDLRKLVAEAMEVVQERR